MKSIGGLMIASNVTSLIDHTSTIGDSLYSYFWEPDPKYMSFMNPNFLK